jgi:hypothetical protein
MSWYEAWRKSMRHQTNSEQEISQYDLSEGIKEMIDDAVVAINAAQAMADRFGKSYCILSDLSVHEATPYTQLKAVEVVHPREKRYE